MIEATQKEYVKEEEETVHTFLESLVDFSIISNLLSAIGINRTTYLNPELYVQPSGLKVTNQLIVELSKASKATKTPKGLFFKWIFVFPHCEHSPKLERWINKMLKSHDKLLNNKRCSTRCAGLFL